MKFGKRRFEKDYKQYHALNPCRRIFQRELKRIVNSGEIGRMNRFARYKWRNF